MTQEFWDRKDELGVLRTAHAEGRPALVKIYGRRRVGKTELVRRFLQGLPKGEYLYYYVNDADAATLRDLLSAAVASQLGESVKFPTWQDFFFYIKEKSSKHRFVLALDEVPRFLDNDPSFLTGLQHAWDTDPGLKRANVMILLIGSSIGMMDRMTGSKAGPLYGRVTVNIRLQPLRYGNLHEAFPGLSEEERIALYAVFGGTPHYLRLVKDSRKGLMEAIEELVSRKTAALYHEPLQLLEIEGLRSQGRYHSILNAIAAGHRNLPAIASATAVPQEQLPSYLYKMDHLLDLVEPADPVGGKKKLKRYTLREPFFLFWYRFVFPHLSALEMGDLSAFRERLRSDLHTHIGHIFERIVREVFLQHQGKGLLGVPLRFSEIGGWWDRREELDVVAWDEKSRTTYIADVKYTREEYGMENLRRLEERSRIFPKPGLRRLFVFSRSGFTAAVRREAEKKGVRLADLKDLKRLAG